MIFCSIRGIIIYFKAQTGSLSTIAHVYKSMNPETERTMEFYNETRVDGLRKRVENAREMTEYFAGRSDFLYYRHTNFGKRTKRAQILVANPDANARPIMVCTGK